MDTTQLRYFVAVVDCQSFSKAANHCHTSQPNLSEQVRNLESHFGIVLLDRSGRRIVPTEAGRILWQRAKGILSEMEDVKKKVRAIASPDAARMTLGIIPTFPTRFLSRLLESFAKVHPKTCVDISHGSISQLLSMLEVSDLDVVIVGLPLRRKGFTAETLFSEEMLLALPRKHPLAFKKVILKEDLVTEKLILSREGVGQNNCPFQFCKNNGLFSPLIVFRSGHLETINLLVESGVGISLIPEKSANILPATIVYRKVENLNLKRSIAVVTKNKRSLKTSAAKLIHHLRNTPDLFK